MHESMLHTHVRTRATITASSHPLTPSPSSSLLLPSLPFPSLPSSSQRPKVPRGVPKVGHEKGEPSTKEIVQFGTSIKWQASGPSSTSPQHGKASGQLLVRIFRLWQPGGGGRGPGGEYETRYVDMPPRNLTPGRPVAAQDPR